ncbi:MAG: hypothetical protein NVS3B9_6980 [Candidatus Doudnabacteria bacterium]
MIIKRTKFPLFKALFSIALLYFVFSFLSPVKQAKASVNPVLDASTTMSSTGLSATTWTHTVGATGTNRLLTVTIYNRNVSVNGVVASVTYNGVALTALSQVLQTGAGYYTEVWYLVNPPTGANSVTINVANGGSQYLAAVAASWTGVNTTTPFGTPTTSVNNSLGGAAQTMSIPNTTTADTILSVVNADNTTTTAFTAPTVEINHIANVSYSDYSASTAGASGSTPVVFSQSAFSDWNYIGVAIHSSSAPITFSLSGIVFNDLNNNGVQDTGENGYAGVALNLSGAASASTVTASNGTYSFTGLSTGSYTLTMTPPNGYNASTVNPVNITLSGSLTSNFGITAQTNYSTGVPAAMPIISWGVPTFASSVSGTNVVSNLTTAPGNETTNSTYDQLNNKNWQSVSVPAWVALDLSTVPAAQRGKVDVLWYNNTNAYDCCLIASGGTYAGLPRNYTIEANSATGGGTAAPATGWVTLATVTSNTYHERENVVDLTGYNWVRVNVSTVNGTDTAVQLMHLDVFDLSATAGVPKDSWFFVGDSITLGSTNYAKVYFGSALNFTYSTKIQNQLSNRYPAQTDGGIVGASTNDGVAKINTWLAAFPGRYVDIGYGTNDATAGTAPTTFYNNYETIIQAVLNAGKVPLVPKIPWASNTTTQANVPGLNAQLDTLYKNYPQIIKGPDFYAYFFNHQSEIGAGDVHPNDTGYADMRRLWACSMLISVYGVPNSTVAASSDCSPYATYLPGSTAPTTTYNISGIVFNDTNSNGVKDVGESAFAGATLSLSGASTASATSAADGSYSFSGLASGSYTVTISPPSGYLTTSPNPISLTISANGTANFGLHQSLAPTPGVPALDTYSTATSTSLTVTNWSHTVTSAGADRILIVSLGSRNSCTNSPLTSVTYNGVALTNLAAILQNPALSYYSEVWYLVNPASGTHTISVTSANGGCEYLEAVASSWTGVNQTVPFGTLATSTNSTPLTTVTLNLINTQTTDVGFLALSTNNSATATFNSPATVIGSVTQTGASMKNYISQTPGLSGSTAMTFNTGSFSEWVAIAAPLRGSSSTITYTLSGHVFRDSNNNGVQDSWEVGVENATVSLTGPVSVTVTTDKAGAFVFTGLTSGSYTAATSVQNGYTASTTNPITIAINANTVTNFGVKPNVLMTGLHTSGNQILNGSNIPVRLLGINRGATSACVQNYAIFSGPPGTDQGVIQTIANWNITAVRVPINEDCWLNINGSPAAYSGVPYQNEVTQFIQLLAKNNIATILDLHWTAPGAFLSQNQQQMADTDHASTFWTSVANTFKDGGSAFPSALSSVVFDLYNEPYPDNNGPITQAVWQCLRDGCQKSTYLNSAGAEVAYTWQAAGMQSLIQAVRDTGATNLVMVGGPGYAGLLGPNTAPSGCASANWLSCDPNNWLTYKPVDKKTSGTIINNLAASVHIYGDTADPLGNYSGNYCHNVTCWNGMVLPVIQAGYPVVTGEVGESDCLPNFINGLMSWMDGYGQNYTAWHWWPQSAVGCANYPLLGNDSGNTDYYSGVPSAYGIGLKNHLAALVGGSTPPPIGSGSSGGSGSVPNLTVPFGTSGGYIPPAISLGGGGGTAGGFIAPTTITAPVVSANQKDGVPTRLIKSGLTFYVINNNQKYGIPNPGILFSNGFAFKDAHPATDAESALPIVGILSPGVGALVKSPTSRTVYLISGSTKYAFSSAFVFSKQGFSFTNVLVVPAAQLSSLANGIISDPYQAHLFGTDINLNGTIYFIWKDNTRQGYTSADIYDSWHVAGNYKTVVPANAADLKLPVQGNVIRRNK